MSELFKIIIAVISGTITYVLTKFILDSILEQKKIVHEIGFCLINYPNIYLTGIHNNEKAWEVSDKFSRLASEMLSTINKIPFYNFFEKTNAIYHKEVIEKVSNLLIGISGNIYRKHIPGLSQVGDFGEENQKNAEEICRLLKIKINLS